jgi:prepilin-type N-terminal cleavage/methylation domain-containing protein
MDNPIAVGIHPSPTLARLLGRARREPVSSEAGFTLVELLVTIVIMAVLLAPIVSSMLSALNAQAQQLNVAVAQEQARLALQRMRKDIHCAHAVETPVTNASGGETIIFTETNTTGVAECPGLIAQNASAVEWCTIPVSGYTDRYQLYRENNPNNACDSSQATYEVDYITQADLWSLPTCNGGEYPTVAVSLPVDVDPSSTEAGTYDLSDQIALRNASTC